MRKFKSLGIRKCLQDCGFGDSQIPKLTREKECRLESTSNGISNLCASARELTYTS